MLDLQVAIRKSAEFFIAACVLAALFFTAEKNYLLFHSIAELFSIIVGYSIFILAWNSRRIIDSDYILFIGIAFLFISSIDLLHTLAYDGMGVFPAGGSNMATQLWISGRYLESVTLMISPVFLFRKLKPIITLILYSAVTALVCISIYFWKIFPMCYLEGRGLTPFKIWSELIICAFLAAAGLLLLWHKERLASRIFRLIFFSIIVTIVSEFFFTEYVSVHDIFNLLGHIFKIVSYYLIYTALIQVGLGEPYEVLFRNLKQSEKALRESEEKFRTLTRHSPVGICLTDPQGMCQLVNDRWSEMTGLSGNETYGRSWTCVLHPEDLTRIEDRWRDLVQRGGEFTLEYRFIDPHGKVTWVAGSTVALRDLTGEITGYLGTATDISVRKKIERQLEEINMTLEQRVAERTAVAEKRAAQLRAMALELTRTEQRERKRIAQILHDHLQQLLVGVKINVNLLCETPASTYTQQNFQQVNELLDQSISATRSLAVELNPPALHYGGFLTALQWLAQWMRDTHDIRVDIEAEKNSEPQDENVRIILFQIVRELLLNVVKHAKVDCASITVCPIDNARVKIVVADNGVGFDPDNLRVKKRSHAGYGLFNIRERLDLLGGELVVESAPGEGSRFSLYVPLASSE
jgi:PAS domain S-box-containing protein